jgi:hypothetical protein
LFSHYLSAHPFLIDAKASPAQKTAKDCSGTSLTDNIILKLRGYSFSVPGNFYHEVCLDGGAWHENLTLITRIRGHKSVAAGR